MQKKVNAQEVFSKLGGTYSYEAPVLRSQPEVTKAGTLYFVRPGVALLARPRVFSHPLGAFLRGFSDDLKFDEYPADVAVRNPLGDNEEFRIQHGTSLIKVAGQTCYMSFGPGRSRSEQAQTYIDNILKSGHGSVLEHAQYTFLIWGADRAFTHELVRHRMGVAFSQVSQRYVDGKVLRFVERPEYQKHEQLHANFVKRIDRAAAEYAETASILVEEQLKGNEALSGEKKTELRKKVNQAARSSLPNETEAPIVFSANIRALRHICEMRAASPADVPIREVTSRIFLCMHAIEPMLFNDYSMYELADGTYAVETDWRKV